MLQGEGGYEGLALIARMAGFWDVGGLTMRGYIIDGTFPLPPGFAATD